MEQLPERDAANVLSVKEVTDAVNSLKNHKTVGADGIPVEIYKVSSSAFQLLFNLLQNIWVSEDVPEDLGVIVFKMLYKNKDSPDDPTKYRCIGLLNSAYKVLSAVMLARLVVETSHYLQDWQAGFRQTRGCRDNVMILRTMVNKMMREGKPLVLTFIDYTAAFDSVGHKFIDSTLGDANAKPQTRAIFRSIYSKATAKTKVKGVDGKIVYSETFPVRRGVIQGDITSPWYFILVLEAILRARACACVFVCACVYACVCVCLCVRVRVCLTVCARARVCVLVSVQLRVFIYCTVHTCSICMCVID